MRHFPIRFAISAPFRGMDGSLDEAGKKGLKARILRVCVAEAGRGSVLVVSTNGGTPTKSNGQTVVGTVILQIACDCATPCYTTWSKGYKAPRAIGLSCEYQRWHSHKKQRADCGRNGDIANSM
jgi:hypothetical protein